MTKTKPPLCICEGPYEKRDPKVWTWGREGSYYVYRSICPIHGFELRKLGEKTEGLHDSEIKRETK